MQFKAFIRFACDCLKVQGRRILLGDEVTADELHEQLVDGLDVEQAVSGRCGAQKARAQQLLPQEAKHTAFKQMPQGLHRCICDHLNMSRRLSPAGLLNSQATSINGCPSAQPGAWKHPDKPG